jgi:phage terminase large subunit GpA-like protein
MGIVSECREITIGESVKIFFDEVQITNNESFLKKLIAGIPTRITTKTVTEYVNGKRIMPADTPRPGPFDISYTPYLKEIQDNLSANSPIIRTVVMKGHQIGFTTAAENVTCYWMDEHPASIQFMSATEDLLKDWVNLRLEPAIDSLDFRSKIVSQSGNARSRKTGDKATLKEFPGGFLVLASAQSPGKQRSKPIMILIRDEIDGAPRELTTGEGNWLQVSEARTSGYGTRKKILDFSTPIQVAESEIYPAYLDGDQRKYFVPCPHCGAFQELVWESEEDGSTAGMKWDLNEEGQVLNVWYECAHCQGKVHNHNKSEMLKEGYWQATAVSSSATLRSYQISSLYAPVGMLSWKDVVEKYLEAQKHPDGMRSFKTLYLGLPFEETGNRPKVEDVVGLRGKYRSGEVPDGVLFVTLAVDVQEGSAHDPSKPPRLELEICGHGIGYRTWSLGYRRLVGAVADPNEGAWQLLDDMWRDGSLELKRADGRVFFPVVAFIDSGTIPDTVYEYCQGMANTFPVKGFNELSKRANEKGDEKTKSNFVRYRETRINDETKIITISTNYYKNIVYRCLQKKRRDTGAQPPGFSDFPMDYPRKYFEMLTAEERRSDGSFHASGRANEALDCRVYNLCAAELYLDSKVTELRKAFQQQGTPAHQLALINSKWVLENLAKSTARILK